MHGSGQVLCSVNDIDEEYLFDQNTIVDFSRVSSLETKSLLMGVLILKLNEYRMCTSEENQPLRHVTVMEEAHNILKRSPTGGSEGSNVQAKSVEMISSAIAEMRTYGEGFIIVDQSPTAVDVSAVKNTNTKIIMRLPDYEDCKIAGLSMGLNDSQIREISRFPMGVAVVYQNNWVEAVLTQIDKSEEQYHQTDLITDDYALAVIKGQLAVELVFQYETGLAAEEGFQLDDLLEIINSSDINASKKQDIVQSMVDWCSCFEREAPVNGSFAAKLAEFISCNGLFEALPIRFAKDYKNEPKITRDSAVFFETQTDVTVGSAAKESAKMYPEQVVTFIKRSIGQPGFSLNLNGIDMKPEEISSYILKKVVKDAEDTLRMEGKLGDDEQIRDVVITCPAYFGVTERDATKAAGVIAGLNVLAIINEPTAAAITYGVTDDSQNKTVLVYDLGGGTFDITMINIKPGEIRVICTGGDHNLGGKDWDDRVLMYLAEQYQSETGTPDSILEDAETLQELSLAAERAKKLLSAKEKAPVAVNYMGERVRVELTREKFDELTEDLLTRTIDLTREMFKEAEKKGFTQNDVSEILLVGGSSKMPQVMSRVKSAFGIETKMFDPDESVAKGAAIYANKMSEFNIVLEEIAKQQGKSVEEVKEQVDKGQMDIQKEAKKANIQMRGGRLPGEDVKIINVSSRSFGTCAYDETDQLKLFNIIIKNAELPATGTNSFYPRQNNQQSVRFQVMECLASDEKVDPELGKEIGTAELTLPAGVTLDTEIQVTFRLDESGLLHLHAKEMKDGREVDAEFQTTEALSEQEMTDAIRRSNKSSVN